MHFAAAVTPKRLQRAALHQANLSLRTTLKTLGLCGMEKVYLKNRMTLGNNVQIYRAKQKTDDGRQLRTTATTQKKKMQPTDQIDHKVILQAALMDYKTRSHTVVKDLKIEKSKKSPPKKRQQHVTL